MESNGIVILTGLVAALIAWAAVADADDANTFPRSMSWSFSRSWTTSAAGLLALAALQFLGASEDATIVLFALLLVAAPLIYSGFAANGGATKALFVGVATLMAWATLAILTRMAQFMWDVTASELSLVPRMVINVAAAAVVVAAVLSINESFRRATGGTSTQTDDAWVLP